LVTPFFTEVDGIIFCESSMEGARIGDIKEFGASQNTTLQEVKKNMASKARAMGGNAIINFKYVQKADKGLHLLKWDKERLNCSGTVVLLASSPLTSENSGDKPESSKAQEIREAAALFENGDISEEEYSILKRKIIERD